MADTQEQSLTIITSPTGTYYVRVVNNTAGTPASVLITLANLLAALPASTTVAGAAEIATTAEIDTASDSGRIVSPGQFRTSKFAIQKIVGTVANPNSYYNNVRAQIPIFRANAALTITRIHIQGADLTPTSEMALDLKFADDLNTGGFANATVIDVCDTTSGVFTATSSFDDATVPNGKYIYWQMDAAPHVDWKDFYFEVYFTYD